MYNVVVVVVVVMEHDAGSSSRN